MKPIWMHGNSKVSSQVLDLKMSEQGDSQKTHTVSQQFQMT
jgi:hypothetical protein